MEIKLFGKNLFEAKKSRSEIAWAGINSEVKESKYLPDFYEWNRAESENPMSDYIVIPDNNGGAVAMPKGKIPTKTKDNKMTIKLTPKGVYELKMLNDGEYHLNTNAEYVDQQLADFKDKLGMVKSEEYDMRRGSQELASIVLRLENRKKYATVKDFFEQFPYTTTSKINTVTKTHDHLKMGQIAQFIADMPKEAVELMKAYNEHSKKLCDKQAVFYIIADKKDFKKTDTRRDPILLAQSPFGHVWQVIGAWDKEMMFLDEL